MSPVDRYNLIEEIKEAREKVYREGKLTVAALYTNIADALIHGSSVVSMQGDMEKEYAFWLKMVGTSGEKRESLQSILLKTELMHVAYAFSVCLSYYTD